MDSKYSSYFTRIYVPCKGLKKIVSSNRLSLTDAAFQFSCATHTMGPIILLGIMEAMMLLREICDFILSLNN